MPGITGDVPISIQQAALQLIASSAPQQGTVRHILTECGQGPLERVINLEGYPSPLYAGDSDGGSGAQFLPKERL